MQECGIDQQFDVSLPISAIGDYITAARKDLLKIPGVHVVHNLGHAADGNIHFAVGKTNRTKELTQQINEVIYPPLQALGGSISAEHGIGEDKKAYLPLSRNQDEIALMKLLKKSLDPKEILNRGKVI